MDHESSSNIVEYSSSTPSHQQECQDWLETFKRRVENLSYSDLKEVLEAITKKLDTSCVPDHEEQIDKLQIQVKEANERINLLTTIDPVQQHKIQDLKNQLRVSNEELDDLSLIPVVEKRIERLELKLKDAKEKIDLLTIIDPAQQLKIRDLESQLKESYKKIDDVSLVPVGEKIRNLKTEVAVAEQNLKNLSITQAQEQEIIRLKNKLLSTNQQIDVLSATPPSARIQNLQSEVASADHQLQILVGGEGSNANASAVNQPQLPPPGLLERWLSGIMCAICILCIPLTSISSVVFGLMKKHIMVNLLLNFFSPIAYLGPAIIIIVLNVKKNKYTFADCIFPTRWGNADAMKDGLRLWAGTLAWIGRIIQLVMVLMNHKHFFTLDLSCLPTCALVIPVIREILGY